MKSTIRQYGKQLLMAMAVLIATGLVAQDKHVHVDLKKYKTLTGSIFLHDGFVLKGGYPVKGGLHKNNFTYFNPECEQVWEVDLKGKYLKPVHEVLVAAPSGKYVYHIETKNFANGNHYLAQLNREGKLKDTEISGKGGFGKSLLSVFADDDYLYYLASQNGDERSNRKKSEEQLLLIRISHGDFAWQRFTLNLPPVESGDHTTFWYFLGQHGGEKFIASKKIEKDEGRNTFRIAAFNAQGAITRQMTLSVELDGKFTRQAAYEFSQSPSYAIVADYDYNTKVATTTTATPGASAAPAVTTTYQKSVPTEAAFANIMLDEASGSLYAYGLFGPKPFTKVGPVYEGFYVVKFNRDGSKAWQLQHMGTKELQAEATFRVHAVPFGRAVALRPLAGDLLNFSLHFKQTQFMYAVSADGNVLGVKRHNNVPYLDGRMFSPTEKLKSDEFIRKAQAVKKEKLTEYYAALTPQGEILIRATPKAPGFDVYYFRK
jgi:hypothetical protein